MLRGSSPSPIASDVKDKLVGGKRAVGQMADPWGVQAARAKRQDMTNPSAQNEDRPNRVYLQFVYNDVNGYPNVDDRNEHIGYLDFDETGLAARGVLLYDRQRHGLLISKVAERPERDEEPMDWYEFDGRSWGKLVV
ncbi:hypothetical protein N658DRAFT_511206 [Parathielavia hyrcaniae]|uniref:Uncharacterized protein n=1 Tax=Parathielavia hyrcaniae TaxID=113614 RepID=A0AAN6SXH4_9PEZI|nr:hypothetical protein N658DRAFT_511206 [Parathielavia hyrcaniae]